MKNDFTMIAPLELPPQQAQSTLHGIVHFYDIYDSIMTAMPFFSTIPM